MSVLAWIGSLVGICFVFTFVLFPAYVYLRSSMAHREHRAARGARPPTAVEAALDESLASPLEEALLAPLVLLFFVADLVGRVFGRGPRRR